MLNLEYIKNHLKINVLKYEIRVKTNSFFRSCSFEDVRIICICENSLFGDPLDSTRLKSKNDFDYIKRFIIANLLQNENFGNIKFSLNFYACNGENKIFDEKMIEIIQDTEENNVYVDTGELWTALGHFWTRGDKYLMAVLKGPKSVDYTKLFKNPSLPASEDLSTFIKMLDNINPYDRKLFKFEDDARFIYNETNVASDFPILLPRF